MDRAINKSTGKIVSALEIFKDGSYQNLEKGEWISPRDSIHNWDELDNEEEPVHYVQEKEYTNWNKTDVWCSPHFSVYPNSKAKTIEESPQHKMLKNWLFTKLKNDDLEIRYAKGTKPHKYNNLVKLSELPIDWNNYEIEITTRSYKYLRADILIPFIKKDILLGNGLIFEIQLSLQTEERTFERSIERALHGYSVVWLFKKNFIIDENNKDIELKSNIIDVNSFSSELHYSGKKLIKSLKYVVEEQCRFLDNKKIELDDKTDEIEVYKEKFIQSMSKKINSSLNEKIQSISENFSEEISKKIQSDFIYEHQEEIKIMIREICKKILDEKLIIEVTNELKIKDILEEARENLTGKISKYNVYREFISNPPRCSGCNSPLILSEGQYGLWIKCSNYPMCKIKNNHAIPLEIKELFNEDN